MSTPILRLPGLCRVRSHFARSINMADSCTSTVLYSDSDLLIVLEFTYSLVENYIKNKNQSTGVVILGKGNKYFNFTLDNF